MSAKRGFVDGRKGDGWTWSILVLAVVTLTAGLPLLLGRVLAGHDIVVYLINAQQTVDNLRSGEIFPAWGGGFNAGYGAPSLLFFPPLTSYLHGLPILGGVPVIVGVSFWSLTGLFLSGFAVFGWLRSSGFGQGALQAAVIYMVSAYRLVDLYDRSALAEHWAFVWPPLIVWAATSPRLTAAARSALTAFSVAMLLLSNIPLGVLFGLGLIVWFAISEKLGGRRLSVFGGAILGFGIASFAIIPQALSSSLLSVDQYYGSDAGRFRPSNNTLFSGEVIAWDFNTQMSVVFVSTFVLILVAFVLLPSKLRGERGVRAALIGSIICLVGATWPAGLVWDALPLLSKFQFPWRVASLLTFGLTFMAANLRGRRGWLLVALVVAVSLPFFGWTRTQPRSIFMSEKPPKPPSGKIFPDPYVAWEAGSGGWYWRHQNLAEIWFLAANVKPFLLPDLAGNPARQLDPIRNRPAVVLDDPAAAIRVVSWGSTKREVEVDTSVAGTLMWRVINFPDMRVTVDGESVPTEADPTTGLVTHLIPVGDHRVVWSWFPFPALRLGRLISAGSLLFSCALLVIGFTRRHRHLAATVAGPSTRRGYGENIAGAQKGPQDRK
jgi:hypothetical protein